MLMLELLVNTETLRFFFLLLQSASFFLDQAEKKFLYSNNDKTWAQILNENDFKEPGKADAQNLIQIRLKIANYHTLHNRTIGTLHQNKAITKDDKRENLLLPSAIFFFKQMF